jgi:hypothetical protein
MSVAEIADEINKKAWKWTAENQRKAAKLCLK